MDKILVVFDKPDDEVTLEHIFQTQPYERVAMNERFNSNLIVWVSKKNQDVTILKNRHGSPNDPNIINFYKSFYGIINSSSDGNEEKESEVPVDRFEMMDFDDDE